MVAGDPWDGRSLEWSVSAPPPEYNFAVIPTVMERDTFAARKERGQAYERPHTYEDIKVPRRSMAGMVIGIAGGICAFGLVWHIWWLAIAGMLTACGTVIALGFARDTHRIIGAAEVARVEKDWLDHVAAARRATHGVENAGANQGLAESVA